MFRLGANRRFAFKFGGNNLNLTTLVNVMHKIEIELSNIPTLSYPIFVGPGLLTLDKTWLSREVIGNNYLVIITDNIVKKLYGNRLRKQLKDSGYKVLLIAFPSGEKSKTYKTKQYIEKLMLKNYCDRNTIILALGGGVVGDMAGFIAATYMRGISYIQIPTTLLAMVDSSIGGKTGINISLGKNLIGAYWQPKAVIADIQCLNSLSKKQLVNGFIEALKVFLTSDAKSFQQAANFKSLFICNIDLLGSLIIQAINIKATIVSQDVNENNKRVILNFGHTIGHALEQLSDYKLLHGYAVALGILVESKISHLLGLLNTKQYQIIKYAFSELGILGKDLERFDIDKIIEVTKIDKKAKIGRPHYVLLKEIGKVHIDNNAFAHIISDDIVKQAILNVIIE